MRTAVRLAAASMVFGTAVSAAPAPRVMFGGWCPEFKDDLDQVRKHDRQVDSVSLFYYGVAPSGTVFRTGGPEDAKFVAWAKKKGIKVWATVGGTPPVLPAAISGTAAEQCVQDLADLAQRHGFDGIDVDFEGIDKSARQAYSEFASKLAIALKALSPPRGLACTVQDFPGPEDEATMAFDYGRLAEIADEVRVMLYDYSFDKPGPIMPHQWFADDLKFARSKIPAEKFVAALPWYGRDWIPAENSHEDILQTQTEKATGLAGYQELKRRFKVRPKWDADAGEMTFTYTRDGKLHVVWMPEAKKFAWMADEVKRAGAAGVYVWNLAHADHALWEAVKKKLGTRPSVHKQKRQAKKAAKAAAKARARPAP